MDNSNINIPDKNKGGNKPMSVLINLILYGVPIFVIVWVVSEYLFPKPDIEGKPAPTFKTELVGGGTFDLAEHLGKRPVLLDFWAIWCPPCRKALPKVCIMSKEYEDRDIAICTVNLTDSADAIQTYLQANDLKVPVALDTDGAIATQFKVHTIPMLVFIDRTGTIVEAHLGGMTEKELVGRIEKLLADE